MDSPFLIRPPQLNQASESGSSSGGGNGVTRRAFIKRTGVATVATIVAWNLQVATARARVDEDTNSNAVSRNGYLIKVDKVDFTNKSTDSNHGWMMMAIPRRQLFRSENPYSRSQGGGDRGSRDSDLRFNSEGFGMGRYPVESYHTTWGLARNVCSSVYGIPWGGKPGYPFDDSKNEEIGKQKNGSSYN